MRYAAGQDFSFPGGRRDLVGLQLADYLQHAVGAMQLRAGRDVLPALEEAHEIGGVDRLDFAAQAADGEAMDARQEAAMAPLRLLAGRAGSEASAENLAFGLQLRQRGIGQRTG